MSKEVFYPLVARVCGVCFLVQLDEYVSPATIFDDYAYFSSYSQAWLDHSEAYVEMASERFGLGEDSMVVEIASNDGYLLQFFVERNVPCLGIEPARTVADAAEQRGVPTLRQFFGRDLAMALRHDRGPADLLIANNVLAQVSDLNSFVEGFGLLLGSRGVATVEFPHLLKLIERNEFDTIYHEHYSYFSLGTAIRVFEAHGLRVFDVEELWTHGGSLRLFLCHSDDLTKATSHRVGDLLEEERRAGLLKLSSYEGFGNAVAALKRDLLSALIDARRDGQHVVAYGAPGKGNTLLNYCGIRTDFIDYAVDRNPYKHGRLTPGTHIPIFSPDRLAQTEPDLIVILPWNLRDEIVSQLTYAREWGARFLVPIPRVEVFD